MEILFLGIISLALAGLVFGTDDDGQQDPDLTETGDDDTQASVAFIEFDGSGDLMGSDGNDTIALVQPGEAIVPMNEAAAANGNFTLFDDGQNENVVSAGAGDDLIQATSDPETNFAAATPSQIDAGSGNDTIDANGLAFWDTSIEGGSGNDIIRSLRSNDATTLSGGAGDDLIELAGSGGEANVVDGGEGNDTIYETDVANVFIRGGAGDDVLSVSNQASNGTGYTNLVDAGEGNDTIILDESASHDTRIGPGELGGASALVYGGPGSDTWDVTVDEGMTESDFFDVPLQANGAYRMDAIEIADFEPGIDTLEIDATPQNDAFTLTSARIEQVDDDGQLVTELVLRYESATETARDVTIDLRDAALTWDDVTFVGDQTPQLLPIAATAT